MKCYAMSVILKLMETKKSEANLKLLKKDVPNQYAALL